MADQGRTESPNSWSRQGRTPRSTAHSAVHGCAARCGRRATVVWRAQRLCPACYTRLRDRQVRLAASR